MKYRYEPSFEFSPIIQDGCYLLFEKYSQLQATHFAKINTTMNDTLFGNKTEDNIRSLPIVGITNDLAG